MTVVCTVGFAGKPGASTCEVTISAEAHPSSANNVDPALAFIAAARPYITRYEILQANQGCRTTRVAFGLNATIFTARDQIKEEGAKRLQSLGYDVSVQYQAATPTATPRLARASWLPGRSRS